MLRFWGTTVFIAVAVAACGGRVAEISSGSSGGSNGTSGTSSSNVAPSLSGGPCDDRLPCVAGLVCETSPLAKCGTCVTAPREGFPCEEGSATGELPCGPGLVCTPQGSSGGLCVKLNIVGAGGACSANPPSSAPITQCDAGLECDTGTCVSLGSVALNGTCDDNDECIDGAYCSDAGTCLAKMSVGAICESGAQCGTGVCCDLDSCPSADLHTCIVQQNNEGPCSDDSWCEPALYCRENKCISRIAEDSTCDPAASGNADPSIEGCAPALACDPNSNTCASPRSVGPGEKCNNDFACGRDQVHCVQGVCERDVGPGDACDDDSVCPPLYGCDHASNTCQPEATICAG